MKAILTIMCALMLTITAYAQEPDKTLIKVVYNFSHIRDTTNRDKPYTENMLLIAGKTASLYTSYDRLIDFITGNLQRQELRKNGFTDQEINEQNRNKARKSISPVQYYYFTKENKFFSMEDMCINGCLVEDEIEKPDWKILKDTLSFSGIHCQKATTSFKGRNWTAWFAPELPFAAGPWKLSGLPGLIIEAYDSKKQVQFKFGGIEKVKDGDYATEDARNIDPMYLKMFAGNVAGLTIDHVSLPTAREFKSGGYTKVTKKEFDKLKAAYDKDPDVFRAAQFASNGLTPPPGMFSRGSGGGRTAADGTVISQTQSKPQSQPAPKVVINNPIELPEKK